MSVTTTVLPRRIIHHPDPRLRRKCVPIERFDSSVAALAQRMLDLMHAGHGVGLAAPQVGRSVRLIVWNATGEPGDDGVAVNPELLDLAGSVEAEEGCLSIPDVRVTVRRARRGTLRAHDVNGQPFEIEGDDLLARIWQHEVDHLDGRLIIDRMNTADRIANKKTLADLESQYARGRKRGA